MQTPNGKLVIITAAQYQNILLAFAQLVKADTVIDRTKKRISALELEVFNLVNAANVLETAVAHADTAIDIAKDLTKAEKRREKWRKVGQWFRDKLKDIIAWLLGIIAATEAAIIIYQNYTP